MTFFSRWLESEGRTATLDELNRAASREWLAVLSDTHGTVKVRYRGLFRFCSWLVEEGELPANPMATLSPPTLKMKPVPVVSALDCGVRVSEACGLRVDDLDLDQGMAIVLGKGRRHRAIYFSARTTRALDRYIRMRANIAGRTSMPCS